MRLLSFRIGLVQLVYILVVVVLSVSEVRSAVFPLVRDSRISASGSCGGNSGNEVDSSVSFDSFNSTVVGGAGCLSGSSGSEAIQNSELILVEGQLMSFQAFGSCNGSAGGTNVPEDNNNCGSSSSFELEFSIDSDSTLISILASIETSGTTMPTAWGTAQATFFLEDLSSSEFLLYSQIYSDEVIPSYNENLELLLAPGDYKLYVRISCNASVDSYVNSGSASALAGFDIQVDFKTVKKIRVLDRLNNPFSITDFELSRSAYDIPHFTETDKVTVTTNDSGYFNLPAGFEVGDTIKIAKTIHIEPSKKHISELGTVFSISLDNRKFDVFGQMSYNELSDSLIQQINLNKATIHWNLLVSIEWDAHLPYIQHTEEGFRRMTNYLYDVTDGQVAFDTIRIFDNREHWNEADIRIYVSNMEWPRAVAKGWQFATGFVNNNIYTTHQPRQWFGNTDKTRNLTYTNDPLDVSDPDDYRTRAHELGHYLFGFKDEYVFEPAGSVRCATVSIYGYMDFQYLKNPPLSMASELSNSTAYNSLACQNTAQWATHNMSCWNLVQNDYEKKWGSDSIFAYIDLPGESELLDPLTYFIGPNDDLDNLDYNIGARVNFPLIHSASDANTITLGVINQATLEHVGNSNVTVLKVLAFPPYLLNQGNTNDSGFIKLLGINQTDIIYGNGYYTHIVNKGGMRMRGSERGWLFGEATIGSPGRSKLGNSSFLWTDDSLTLALIPVAGNYQFIPALTISATATRLGLDLDAAFTEQPYLQQITDSGTTQPQVFTSVGTGYSSQWSEVLGGTGVMRIWGADDSSRSFFVDCPYSAEVKREGVGTFDFFAADGSAILSLHTQDTTAARVSIMSSHYPVLRHGLEEDNLQAGAVQSISLSRALGFTEHSSLTIRYADSELGDSAAAATLEPSLRMFQWNRSLRRWLAIDSGVDTSANEVVAEVTVDGEYAAFSTNIVTDVGEDPQGPVVPFHFELSQNYPNPFNPTTTIRYSLSHLSRVKVEVFNIVGQRVRTLVDQIEKAGSHTLLWNGTDDSGTPVATGVYLYRFQTDSFTQTKKMLLIR